MQKTLFSQFGLWLRAIATSVWFSFYAILSLVICIVVLFTGQWRELIQIYFIDNPNSSKYLLVFLICVGIWVVSLWYSMRLALHPKQVIDIGTVPLTSSTLGKEYLTCLTLIFKKSPSIVAIVGALAALSSLIVNLNLFNDFEVNDQTQLIKFVSLVILAYPFVYILFSFWNKPYQPLRLGYLLIPLICFILLSKFDLWEAIAFAMVYFLPFMLFWGIAKTPTHISTTAIPLLLIVILILLSNINGNPDFRHLDLNFFQLILSSPVSFAVFGYLLFRTFNYFEIKHDQDSDSHFFRIKSLDIDGFLVAIIVSIVTIPLIAFFISPLNTAKLLSAPATIFLALSSWAIIGTLLFVRIPNLLGIGAIPIFPFIIAILISPLTDNHGLQNVKRMDDTRPEQWSSVGQHFLNWNEKTRKVPDEPVFFVTASGGGIRAAYWTAISLALLDDKSCGHFGDRVYAISSVSGGSLGAALFAAARAHVKEKNLRGNINECEKLTSSGRPEPTVMLVKKFFEYDFLSPLLGSMLYPDTLQRFIPAWYPWGDRATVLANSFEVAWREASGGSDFLERPYLEHYWNTKDPYSLPILLFNSTRVEDGKRMIASPVRLYAPDTYWLFESNMITDGLKTSDAIVVSSRFTYVTPAASYYRYPEEDEDGHPTLTIGADLRRSGQLVDGGYFENSGAATALDLLRELKMTLPMQHGELSNSIVVILDNDPATAWDSKSKEAGASNSVCGSELKIHSYIYSPKGFMEDTLAPILALYQTRNARARLHQGDLVVENEFLREISRSKEAVFNDAVVRGIKNFVEELGHEVSKDNKVYLILRKRADQLTLNQIDIENQSVKDVISQEIGNIIKKVPKEDRAYIKLLEKYAHMIVTNADKSRGRIYKEIESSQSHEIEIQQNISANSFYGGTGWNSVRGMYCGFYGKDKILYLSDTGKQEVRILNNDMLANHKKSEVENVEGMTYSTPPSLGWSMSHQSRIQAEATARIQAGKLLRSSP